MIVSGKITTKSLVGLIAQELVIKATAMTFLNRPVNKQIQKITEQRLLQTIYQSDQINWQQIKILFKPFPLQIDPQLDQGTKDWLQALEKE